MGFGQMRSQRTPAVFVQWLFLGGEVVHGGAHGSAERSTGAETGGVRDVAGDVNGHGPGFIHQGVFEHDDVRVLLLFRGLPSTLHDGAGVMDDGQALLDGHGNGGLAVDHGVFTKQDAFARGACGHRVTGAITHEQNTRSGFIFLVAQCTISLFF